MANPNKPANAMRQVIFDKKTGRILQTHGRYDVEKRKQAEIPEDELRKRIVKDRYLLDRVTDHDADNIGVLTAEIDPLMRAVVDVRHQKIVPKPALRLQTDKRELAGDGKDNAEISISIVGPDGKVVADNKAKVKVTTTRGKLSERGGIVELKKGRGAITLTSVDETVASVVVRAAATDGSAASAQLVVEFV
jgi:hypothetical protein